MDAMVAGAGRRAPRVVRATCAHGVLEAGARSPPGSGPSGGGRRRYAHRAGSRLRLLRWPPRRARSRPSLTLTTHSSRGDVPAVPPWALASSRAPRGCPGCQLRLACRLEIRRRRRIRRRSRSEVPPHTPWSTRLSRAYSRHGTLHGALRAGLLRNLHADAVAREENRRVHVPALALGHPFVVHGVPPMPRSQYQWRPCDQPRELDPLVFAGRPGRATGHGAGTTGGLVRGRARGRAVRVALPTLHTAGGAGSVTS